MCVYAFTHVCVSQRTACRVCLPSTFICMCCLHACVWQSEDNPWSLFSPSTFTWVLGLNSDYPASVAEALLYPLSHLTALSLHSFISFMYMSSKPMSNSSL